MRNYSINAFCDANWGGDITDRKSRSGYLVYVEGALVSWASRKQNTMARSNTEGEYREVATTTQEIEVVRSALRELGVEVVRPMKILTDNWGASFIAHNPIGHSQLKHVALDLHFVREIKGQSKGTSSFITYLRKSSERISWPKLFLRKNSDNNFPISSKSLHVIERGYVEGGYL